MIVSNMFSFLKNHFHAEYKSRYEIYVTMPGLNEISFYIKLELL